MFYITDKVTGQVVIVNDMKPYGRKGVVAPRIHKFGARLDELSASHHDRIMPRKKRARYEFIVRYDGLQGAGVLNMKKK
jgi:hypothetical protein